MTTNTGRARRGRFITLEGADGSGKTSQAEILRRYLRAAGLTVTLLREPGGTPLGERIRDLLLEHDAVGLSPRTDALLFNAARATLVAETIRPALARGEVVLSARFADSTIAYQGYGSGVPIDELAALERFATDGLRPDLTVLLDLPVEEGLARKTGAERTRFEAGFDLAFHRRVRDGFLALAAAEPDRFVVIDGSADTDAVAAAIARATRERLPDLTGSTSVDEPEPVRQRIIG